MENKRLWDSKAYEAIKELVVTEYKYLTSLKIILTAFGLPLSPSSSSPFYEVPGKIDDEDKPIKPAVTISHQDWHLIFSKIPNFISLHESMLGDFLSGLGLSYQSSQSFDLGLVSQPNDILSLGELGNIFLKHIHLFDVYVSYCESQMSVLRRIQEMRLSNYDLELFIKEVSSDPQSQCRGLDLSAYLLEPMQRLTRYPLLIKQILHNSKTISLDKINERRESFKKSDMSSLLNSLESQIVITECNPFSEMDSTSGKKSNPFSEVTIEENPFDSKLTFTAGSSVLLAALSEIESILSRSNEAAQRKENTFKLSLLQYHLGGDKVLLTDGLLRSPSGVRSQLSSSLTSQSSLIKRSSLSPTRAGSNSNKRTSIDNFDYTLFNKEIIDLVSETKHKEPRIWIKDGLLYDLSQKKMVYVILCSDLILIFNFVYLNNYSSNGPSVNNKLKTKKTSPTSISLLNSEIKLHLTYKPISLLDISIDSAFKESGVISKIRSSIIPLLKKELTSTPCKFKMVSKTSFSLPTSSRPQKIILFKASSDSEKRQWVNLISEAIFNFKNKEILESSSEINGGGIDNCKGHLIGKLTLRIERATELLPVDRGITSHPYCTLKWNELVLKSKVIPNTVNPVWDQEFTLDVYNTLDQMLSIQLFNYKKYSKNEYLGRAEVDLQFLKFYEGNQTGMIPIHLADVTTGTLYISLSYEHLRFTK